MEKYASRQDGLNADLPPGGGIMRHLTSFPDISAMAGRSDERSA